MADERSENREDIVEVHACVLEQLREEVHEEDEEARHERDDHHRADDLVECLELKQMPERDYNDSADVNERVGHLLRLCLCARGHQTH